MFLFSSCLNGNKTFKGNNTLWYRYPALYWNSQALHLGNGNMGISFMGGVKKEVLYLTEASMWTGGPANYNWVEFGVNPKAKKSLSTIRKAILNNNIERADSLVSADFLGSSKRFGHFTSVGSVEFNFQNSEAIPQKYLRALDLTSSIGSVQFEMNNIKYRREYFCSYPDKVLAMKFTANRKNKISFDLKLNIIQDSFKIDVSKEIYKVEGLINNNNRPFCVLIKIKNEGGRIEYKENHIAVHNSNSVELYLTVATNYKQVYPDYIGVDPKDVTDAIMKNIESFDFEQIKRRHISDYKSLYDRVSLAIKSDKKVEKLPTNERFLRLTSGKQDTGFKVLAFNLGRYMIISSSRPLTLPANLQGVWNIFYRAPWSGNYQSNINLQEIYWSCGPTDLIECQQAYIDWIDNLAISGREIAQRVYGTNGWVSHTTGNIWGHAAPIGELSWGMFSVGAAWHCQLVWDQFEFTQDTMYLQKQAYPLLKDAAIFWIENLVPFENYLITAPSVSAEHGALITENGYDPSYYPLKSSKYHYCLRGAFQDIEIIWDLLNNTSKAAEILGFKSFSDTLLKTRDKLLPLRIGQFGQLQEWGEDIDNPECHHRHIAHLYCVCPGNQVHPMKTSELAIAAKKSLDMRGDGRYITQEFSSGGNWSRAYRMWCWTRLMDGNRANSILTEMLIEQGFENVLTFQHAKFEIKSDQLLFKENDLNCHFQLDGSASIPGCIAEMLVQSHQGEIHLLPALPDEFKSGKVIGLKARGNYKINMEWENKELVWAEISTNSNCSLPPIRIKERIVKPNTSKEIKIKTKHNKFFKL